MQKLLNNFFNFIFLAIACSICSSTWASRSNSKFKICPKEKTTINGTFEWKINSEDDENYVISQPDVCWANDSIVLRECNFENGEWQPIQVQCTKYHSKNIKCPDDLSELLVNNEYWCLKVSTKKQTFDEHFCYGSDFIIGYTSATDSTNNEILKFLLKKYKIRSFWMPFRRYEGNEFNPFVIRLPGEHWNELFIDNIEPLSANNHTLSADENHCMAAFMQNNINAHNVAMQLVTANCNELHYSVCVTKKHFVAKSGCPQDFGALSHRPNECYGITWDGQQYPEDFRMLNIIEYFKKINTINVIFEELDIVNDKYVEVAGAVEISGKKWAIRPKNNEMKIISSVKKIHGLCVEYIESRKNVEMILRMDPDFDSLILTVYNKFYIWSNNKPEKSIYCFTNANYEVVSRVELKKIWENDSQTKTIFKLKIKSDDPGQYWCEGHTIFNFTHVLSPKVVAAKTSRGHVFAMQTEVSLTDFISPFSFNSDQMKDIATSIKKDVKNVRKSHREFDNLIIHNIRIMKILHVPPNGSYLHCICHATVSTKSSTLDASQEPNSEADNTNQEGEESYPETAVLMQARNLLISLMNSFQPRFAKTVQSIEFCFPENEWLLARTGQTAVKSKLCLRKNGLPMTRKCLGDFIGGAFWGKPTLEDCVHITQNSLLTSNLYNIEKKVVLKAEVDKAIRDVRELLELNLKKLIPADIFYLSKIIRNAIRSIFRSPVKTLKALDKFKGNRTQPAWNTQASLENTVEIVRILNYLLEVNERVIRSSAALNSTNILLDAFEYLLDHASLLQNFPESTTYSPPLQNQINDDKEIEIIEYVDVGVVVKIATNFVIFDISPQIANVSGIALFRIDLSSGKEFYEEGVLRGSFQNECYRFILANQSVEELLNEKDIVMGTFVPTSLWERLDEISMLANHTRTGEQPERKIVIKIYANHKLFQETNPASAKLLKNKVISISIPEHNRDLPEMLPLILTTSEEEIGAIVTENDSQVQKHYCGYWDYQTWANDGVTLINRSEINNHTVLCGCSHLTPFAFLIGGSYKLSVDSDVEVFVRKLHKEALDIITLIGCSLSLFGIAGLFVTACTFRSWRQKANSKVLLQLSAAIALQMILFCFVNTEENSHHLINHQVYGSCVAIGASLHYSVLVQFCWMAIIAYLQFKRYVQVFGNTRPNRFFIKSTILGWVVPLFPVICVLILDSESYIPKQGSSANPLCYPSGISFYTSIVLPITLVIIANLVIFIVVIYNLLRNPAGAIRHTEKNVALSQIRLLVLLFFLLGFTWIFGLLNAMKAGLIFSYLFCLTATLQGFILFLYFVVMDPVTRRMWHGYFARMCGLKLNKDNTSSSVKETTQTF